MGCPTSPAGIIGCGSERVTEPDFEGIVDCLDCGIFFDPTKEAVWRSTRPTCWPWRPASS